MTPTDVDALTALARYGTFTRGHFRRWFYHSDRTISSRLSLFHKTGLITVDRTLEGVYGRLYQPTNRALRLVSSPLPSVREIRFGTDYTHSILVTDVLLSLEKKGFRVLTEREISYAERSSQDERDRFASTFCDDFIWYDPRTKERRFYTVGIPPKSSSEKLKLHFPDGAFILRDGSVVALEVEREPKSRTRTREIINAYTPASSIATPLHIYSKVLWVVSPAVNRMFVGKDGLFFEDRKGGPLAVPTDPKSWTSSQYVPHDPSHRFLGFHVLEKINPVDEGAAFAMAKATDPRTRGLSRTQWLAQHQPPQKRVILQPSGYDLLPRQASI